MATRSVISIEKDGKIFSAGCHWDGYVENNGSILFKHYQNPEKILQLITLGDMSSLGQEVESSTNVDSDTKTPLPSVTVYRGRDQGESDTEFQVWDTREDMIIHYWDCDYFYLWTDQQWVYRERARGWQNLKDAVESIEEESAE